MKTFHIFALFTSIVLIFCFVFFYTSREPYDNNLSFEENLFQSLKNNELTNFIKYLNFLNDNKNTSTKLVDENIYDMLKNKSDLSLDDIKVNM